MTDPHTVLCLACGLCCDGNLFTQVPVRSDELERVRRRGLPILERSNGHVLPQRCAALDGCRCEIYDDRPAACRGYRCMLYAAMGEGEVSLPEALEIVAQAHAKIAAAQDPGEGAVMQRARQARQSGTLASASPAAQALMYLSRHFQRDTKP